MNETFSPSRAILIAPHTFFLVMLDKLREKRRYVLYKSDFIENKTTRRVLRLFLFMIFDVIMG